MTDYRREDDARIERIERGVDALTGKIDAFMLRQENRVTKLETTLAIRGGLAGFVGGIMASVVAGVILALVLRK